MNRVELLKQQLAHHDDLYYNKDNPEISDIEYDALKEEYLVLSGLDEYAYVPGQASQTLGKITHLHPVTSLDKVNSEEELRTAIRPLMPVVIQPKFDGLTLVVYDGKAATRGNGSLGEDVTHTARRIPGMDKFLDSAHRPLRGEVLMPISVFNRINLERLNSGKELFKNPRNAAAGMLRNKDSQKVQGLRFYYYDIMGSVDSETVKLNILDDNAVFDCLCTPSVRFDDIEEAVEYVMNYDRTQHDYEIDGLVIKSDKRDSLRIFGSTGHHPKNAVAYKFPSQGQWTTLRNVIWQVGRTGRVSPVAEFDPIDILGSTITRATLHNMSIIKGLGLQQEDEIFVVKANDVIPAIIKRKARPESLPIEPPAFCPSCGSELVPINDHFFCKALDCPFQLVRRITHMAKRDALDIEGLSEETAIKIVASGLVNKVEEIFMLSIRDIENLDGFAQKSAKTLFENIHNSRRTTLKKFIYAAGIPNIGRSVSEDLERTFGTWEACYADFINGFPITKTIDGIGEVILRAILENIFLFNDLSRYFFIMPTKPAVTAVPGTALTIVVTGTFMDGNRKVSRNEIQDMIKASGHKTSGSVSKNTDYVLVGESAGSKADKAADLGVKTITTLDELKEILQG